MPRPAETGSPGRLWPHPILSVLLALAWLLLQQSLAVPQLITAAVLGWLVPRVAAAFLGPGSRPHGWGRIVRFTAIVLWDIVVSNLTVARIVLSPLARPRPAWVEVPLELRDPVGVSLLATIITTTPGTVSCVVDDERGRIVVHALDCDDPAAMSAQIKQRYEQPLREIFE